MNSRTKKVLTIVGIIVLAVAVVFIVGGPNFASAAATAVINLPATLTNLPGTLFGTVYTPQ
jgi:hypothetical protein